MRQLLMLAAVAGLAVARPEVYREKEDFQFSRSSTDEGSKSGYYGAQRGNMGGNYERAHNMDPLAQNQMSGLVRTVEGELGDGAQQKTGSVYTSANTRGVYGSGNYDLSNLAGRNFQDTDSHSSQSHSSLTSHHGSDIKGQFSESNQARYGSSQGQSSGYRQAYGSRYGGSHSAGNSAQVLYPNIHGSSSNFDSASQYEDRTMAQHSGYSQATGYQGQDYDQGRSLSHTSSGYGSNIHSKLVSANPVRIVIRPGTKVVLPVAAQTYDASQSASEFDQNAFNSETEVLNGHNQHELLKPINKQYESSYSYRKEWEKQDTRPVGVVPLSIPTENPYPANSELYTDTQAQTLEQQRQSANRIASQNYHSSHSGYNVNSASSSQSRQADYNTRSSDANVGYSSYNTGGYKAGSNGAYNAGARSENNRKTASGAYIGNANGLNQIDDSKTRPKSYQSEYSYHKSWEHQGDPYVIKPSTNGLYDGQVSGKLIAGSLNQGAYGSHQYGSQHQTHQAYSGHSDVDCDEQGHVRVARSPGSHYHRQTQERGDVIGQDSGQQTQQQWNNGDELGQQTQTNWNNIEDLGQQTQNNWDQVGQQTENKWDKLQDEGQQTETLWGQQESQREWGAIGDIGQQTQPNQWDQQNVGQQTQNTWDKPKLEPQRQTELGQQTQDTWTTMDAKPSGPDSSKEDNYGMIAQSNDQKLITESHTKHNGANQSTSHHVHTIWDEIKKEEIGQENEDSVESDLTQTADLGQQTQVTWSNINQNENSSNPWHQKTEDKSELDLTNSEQNNKFINTPNPHPWMYNQVHHHQENRSNSNKYYSHNSSSNSFSGSGSHAWQEHSTHMNSNHFNSHAQTHSTGSTYGSSVMSLWDKLDNIEKQTILSHRTDDKVNLNVGHEGTDSVLGISSQPDIFDTDTSVKPQQPINTSTTPKPSIGDKVLHHDIGRGDIEPEVSSNSHDIGRGDIEPENSSNEHSKPVNLNPYKTPKEIETLSITKDTETLDKHDVAHDHDKQNNEDDIDLSVMSLDQQNHSGSHYEQKEHSMWQSGASVTTVMNNSTQISFNNMNQKENASYWNDKNENRNTEQQVQNSDQFAHHQENEHANTDQFYFNIGQKSENVGTQQMEQQFEVQNIGQSENFQEENQKHEAEELGQQNEQFDQVSLSGWKPDDNQSQQEHKLKNWGQENFNKQNQSAGWVENMEQQVQTAWKPTEDLQRQSQPSNTFGHPMEDLSQQVQPAWNPKKDLQQHSELADTFGPPMEDVSQQGQPAWNPTEDLQQHSELADTFGPPMEDLSQQVQPAWNPTEDLQQHSKLADTFGPPIEDLSHQVQPAWNPTEDLQKHSELTTDTFWPPLEDLNQQVQPAWNPTEDLQQHSKLSDSFAQPMEDLNQQKQTAWKPTDLHHQSQITDTFSPQENQNEKIPSTLHKQPDIVEELIVPKKAPVVLTPPETETVTTVKPGFWKSVGSKFTNAKDKVSSWFSS